MEYRADQPIFKQIAATIADGILAGDYDPDGRVPSVRDMAMTMQVNPNTIVRTYAVLEEQGIIRMQRGRGYFLTDAAKHRISETKRREFIDELLPTVFTTMRQLDMDFNELEAIYQKYQSERSV